MQVEFEKDRPHNLLTWLPGPERVVSLCAEQAREPDDRTATVRVMRR